MKIPQMFYTRLEIHKGLRLNVYTCTKGKPTIGFGINLLVWPNKKDVERWEKDGITREEAEKILRVKVEKTYTTLLTLCPEFARLLETNETRAMVLLNMAYAMGVNGLLKFKNMLRAIREEDWLQASKELLDSIFARDVKEARANELAEQMRTGKWCAEIYDKFQK